MNADQFFADRMRRIWRDGIWLGCALGTCAALLVSVLVGIALDDWRTRNHDRLVREAAAAVEARLGKQVTECRSIVERIGGSSYDQVAALAGQIDGRR